MNDTFTTIDEATAFAEATAYTCFRLGKRVVAIGNASGTVSLLQGAPGAYVWRQMRRVAVPATV